VALGAVAVLAALATATLGYHASYDQQPYPAGSYLFVASIGTDYNILIISRFREETWNGSSPRQAAATAIRTAGPAVAPPVCAGDQLCPAHDLPPHRRHRLRRCGRRTAIRLHQRLPARPGANRAGRKGSLVAIAPAPQAGTRRAPRSAHRYSEPRQADQLI
jgi:hypothetical protein